MINSKINFQSHILLYSGAGADKTCVNATIAALEEQLDPCCYKLEKFEHSPPLLNQDVDLLIIPGGDSGIIASALKSNAVRIQEYIRSYSYLGICAGAIIASKNFYLTYKSDIVEHWPYTKLIDIFEGVTIAPMFKREENDLLNYKVCVIQWESQDVHEPLNWEAFHAKGPCFLSCLDKQTTVLARYERKVFFQLEGKQYKTFKEENPAAAIMYTNPCTKAKAILTGVHPEMRWTDMLALKKSEADQKYIDQLVSKVKDNEKSAKLCMRDILARLNMPLNHR